MGDLVPLRRQIRLARRKPIQSETVQAPLELKINRDVEETTTLQSLDVPPRRLIRLAKRRPIQSETVQAPLELKINRDVGETTTLQSLDDVIKINTVKKNLQSIKVHSIKKKRAQEIYYKKNATSGVSPMLRDGQKRPIKQRIGKLPCTDVDTSTPKIHFNKNFTLRNTIRKRRIPNNYAQMRLNRIREKQRLQSTIQHDLTVNGQKSVIRLKRRIPNFKIKIKNDRVLNSNIKRFKLELNEEIQQQLQDLKKSYRGEKITTVHIIPETTGIQIDTRFSNLS
ncbi:unnamed protein product [Diabrotica balteata]|uniref:Uncharacterized protein n=1 Tax=Diabrotica balteata TaxID=107213 RepID=A0A9P0E1B5_DIABA|nr:unnamed protein product [Diabrotica balteata]